MRRSRIQAVHHGHVDVGKNNVRVGVLRDTLQRLLPVGSEQKLVGILADFAPEFLLEQQLQVDFIVNTRIFMRQGFQEPTEINVKRNTV